MKKLSLILGAIIAMSFNVFSQGWIGNNTTNSLIPYNSALGLTPLNIGIGTNAPTEQLHTTAGVRFSGLTQLNTLSRVLVQDINGKLFWRDASTIGNNGNFWNLIGNGGTNPTINFLGTTDNQRLVFRTNNTEKMTILPGGNVGIGTNTPNANLSFGTSAPNTNRLYLWDGTNNDKFGFGIAGNTLQIYSGAISASTPLGTNITFGNYDGTTFVEYMRLKNGNLGIGTAAPTAQLHTTGGVRFTGILQDNTQSRIMAQDINGNVVWRDVSTISNNGNLWSLIGNGGTNPTINFLGTTDNQRLVFRTNNTEKMTILPGGNVGVGTNTPQAQLLQVGTGPLTGITGGAFPISAVAGNDNFDQCDGGLFALINTGASAINKGGSIFFGGQYVTGGTAVATFARINGKKENANNGDYNGYLSFETRQETGANCLSEKMRITSTGNIGIGTTSPTTQLHTTGGVRFAGILQDNTQTRIMAQDINGNIVWRDVATISNSGNFWSLIGNGGTNPTINFLGTTDNQRLIFRTNNTEKMTILPGGNVGIGTNTPNANLSFGTSAPNTNRLYLWDGTNNDKFGFGIAGNTLQIYSGAISASTPLGTNITFGNYDGTTFVEYMRLKNGNLGIGTNNPTQKLTVFNGTTTGTYTTAGWVSSSDGRLKENVQQIINPLEIITKLNGVYFDWKSESETGRQIGFIAQDVKKVLPEVVVGVEGDLKKGETLGMAYQNIVPVLVEGMKEQQKQIEELKALVIKLSAIKSNDRVPQEESIQQINVQLSDKNLVVLGQNVPNPFDDFTSIGFNIPNDAVTAMINFTSIDGKAIKSIKIPERGKGVINVYSTELSSGIYMYSLVIDGQLYETKRMEVIK